MHSKKEYNTRGSALVVVLILIALLCAGGLGGFYFFLQNQAQTQAQKASEDEKAAQPVREVRLVGLFSDGQVTEDKKIELTKLIERTKDKQGADLAVNSVAALDDAIESPSFTEQEKLMLQIRKAYSLPYTAPQGNTVERNSAVKASYSLYDELYKTTLKYNDSFADSLRLAISSGVARLYEDSCYNTGLFKTEIPSLNTYIATYNAKYAGNDQLVTLSAIADFQDEVRRASKEVDSYVISEEAFFNALILENFSKQLTNEDKVARTQKIREMLVLYEQYYDKPNVVYRYMKSTTRQDTVPRIYATFAYDVLVRATGLSQKYPDVDARYKDLVTYLRDYRVKSGQFNASAYEMWAQLMHLSSQYQRDPKSPGIATTVDALIPLFEMTKKNKDARLIMNFYFFNMQTDMGSWDKIRVNAYAVAKNYPKLKAALKDTGVTFK